MVKKSNIETNAEKSSSDSKLIGYYNFEEIYDYSGNLTPVQTRIIEGKINENELAEEISEGKVGKYQTIRDFREDRIPQRVFSKITQLNKEDKQVNKLGNILSFSNEVALTSFKNALTFKDQNGKIISFFHEIKDKTDYPTDVAKIFELYNEKIQENSKLEAKITELSKLKTEGKPNITVKKETFDYISNKLGNSFGSLFQNANQLAKLPEKTDLDNEIMKNIMNFKNIMVELQKEFKGMKQDE